MKTGSGVPAFWLRDGVVARVLAPLAALYAGGAGLRRIAYARGWRRAYRAPVPVVVVGNLFVGGAGKTPLVIWLARAALARGFRPGVVLRGYGGAASDWPRLVGPESDPALIGDEAVLIARRAGVPVVAGPDRAAAVRRLLAEGGCDLVLADDGLQHYRLARDAEIAVIDAARGLGNGRCLPAGPLREPPSRLDDVDLVIGNGAPAGPNGLCYRLAPESLRRVDGGDGAAPEPGERVHAVAGIGHPERFFATLEELGYLVARHAFPDHHRYREADLDFGDAQPVIMTEKDAVKCGAIARADLWCLPVTATPDARTADALEALLTRVSVNEES